MSDLNKRTAGILHLLPAPLSEGALAWQMPPAVLEVLATLDGFVVENARTARRFLAQAAPGRPLREVPMRELNEHTSAAALPGLLEPVLAGESWGLLSEAGCPAVADPGAELVALAHASGVSVRPHVGPSSILLALMGSGLGGQQFSFHGYLPVPAPAREGALRELEARSAREQATQIFIETPYRNAAVLASILAVCRPDTRLCVATDLTAPGEQLHTATVAGWTGHPPLADKRPSVFLLRAADAPRPSGTQRRR